MTSTRTTLWSLIAAASVAGFNSAFAAAEADMLLAYDSGYASSVGGDDNAEVIAANGVAGSNAINDRSGTGARIRIAGYHKTFGQAGRSSLGGYIGWMSNYGDNELNDVTAAADARGADLVAFICEPASGEGAAAVAQQPGRYAAYGPGNFWANIVAHESGGHNYGIDHRGGRENPKTIMLHNYCGGGSQGYFSNPNVWLNGVKLLGEGSCLGSALHGGDVAYAISTGAQGVADRNGRVVAAPNLNNVVRRWRLNQSAGSAPNGTTVLDDVTGTALLTVLGNGADFTGGGLRIPGGASGSGAAYLQLPGGVLSGHTNVTIEIWARTISVQNWARVMDFHNGTANYITLIASRGGNLNQQRFESVNGGTFVTLDSDLASVAGVLHHYAITYASTGGSSGRWTWYRDGDAVAFLDVAYALSALQDVNNWLGRSAYGGDALANCEYQEVRISNVSMTRDQVLANYSLGPNRVASTVTMTANDPVGTASFNSGANWSDGLAPGAGKTYETYRFQLRTPADGTSRTFAGQALNVDGGGIVWKGTSSSTLTINDLTLNGAPELVQAGSGTWTLAGNLAVKSEEALMRAANGPINLTANLSGSGTLLHLNNTVTLGGNNSGFTGKHVVGDGRFSSILIDSELRLGGNPSSFVADLLTLNRGVLYNTGNVTIDDANRGIRIGVSAGLFNVSPGSTVTLAVPLSSPASGSSLVTTPLYPNPVSGMLIKENSGTLVLTHPNNSHVGEVQISGGTLRLDGAGRLNNGDQALPIVNNASFALNSSANQTISGVISGSGSLLKGSSGTLTLTAANTYTGDTTLGAGTLMLSGSGAIASANIIVSNGATFNVAGVSYTLASGKTLKGTGSVIGNVALAGSASLQPGFSAGTLSLNNNLNMSSGGSATFEVSTSAAGGNDRINVGGNLTLGNAATIRLSALGGASNLDTTVDYILFAVNGTTTLSGMPSLIWEGTLPANYNHYFLAQAGNNIVLRYSAAAPPAITAVGNPAVSVRNQAVTISATVTPGGGTVTNVYADVSPIGGSTTAPLVLSGTPNVYTNTFLISSATTTETKFITVYVSDDSPLMASHTFTNTVIATNKVWNGLASDNNWSSNPNWNLGGPGLVGDSVNFAGSTRLTPSMNASYDVTGVTFNSGAGSFTVGASGGTLRLSGGVTNNAANPQVLNVPVTLNSTQPFHAAAGNLTFGQAIANGGNTITVTGAFNTVFNGAVSGTGGLTKAGAGTMTLAGGYTASGTLQVNGGTGVIASAVSPGTSEVWAGAGAGSVGTINVNAGSTLTVNNWLVAGRAGTGTINVNGGNIVHAGSGNITLGTIGTTPMGTINLNSGTISNLVGETWVGEGSSSSENVGIYNQAGGYASLGNFYIGRYNGSSSACRGTATVTGGTIDAGNLEVGYGFNNTRVGTNVLTLSAGAVINASGHVRLAYAGGSTLWGVLTNNGGTLNVGSTALYLGYWDPCQSLVTVNSGQVNLRNNASIVYGQNGNSSGSQTMNQNGGSVTFYSDAGVTVGGTGSLNLGNAGSGAYVYNLNGGTLTAPQVRKAGGSGTGTFNFNGGTLRAAASSATFLQGLTAANVQSGGAILDTDGKNITVNQALVGGSGGGLTKNGAGTLTLTAANTYNGNTVISNGTLALIGSASIANSPTVTVHAGATFNVSGLSSTFTLGANQTLRGNGTVAGAAIISGTVAPGTSIGTLTANHNVTLNSGSTTRMEISKSPLTNDQLRVTGTLNYGGTLVVTNIAGSLAAGDSFKIFDSGTYAGSFANAQLPPLGAGLEWNTNDLSTNGTISVVAMARTVVWRGDGLLNVWDAGLSPNWQTTNGTITMFQQGDAALFNDAGTNNTPITLLGSLQPSLITVNATKPYTFGGPGTIAGTNALIKTGSGLLTLTGSGHSYAGGTSVDGGTLLVNNTNGSGTGPGAVSVNNGGTLGGTGTIAGPVDVQTGGMMSPGASAGFLTVSNTVTLAAGSATFMEISKTPLTNDQLRVTSTLNYGGLLSVTNLGGTMELGDSFPLFSATSFAGGFASTNLPALDPGLAWNFDAVSGVLSVVQDVATNPTNLVYAISNNVLTLSWPADHTGWRLQAQTNSVATGLGTNWHEVAGSVGTNTVNLPVDSANGSVFYRLIYP